MQCCHNLVIITANFDYSTIHQTRMLLDAVRLLSSMVKFRGSFSNFSVSLAHQVSCAYCLFYTLPSLTRGLIPSWQNHADSAGNPWGWRILGGGESPEKFGLRVKRESTGKLRGNFRVDSPGIFWRFPAEFIGNLQRNQGEI